MQIIAAEMASPPVVERVLAVGHPLVWTERDSDMAVPLLARYQAPEGLGGVDALAGRVDTAGKVAGSTAVAADWPRSQNGLSLS